MSASAILFSFATALCWGIAPLIYRRNLGGLSPYDLNAVRSIGFTGGMVVLALIFNPDVLFRIPSTTVIASSAGIALLANLIGDFLYMASIEAMGVSFAVAVVSTFPLITIATSAIWLKEPLSVVLISGAVIIVLGLNFIRMGYSEREIGPSLRKGFFLAATAAFLWGLSDTMIRWTILETGVDSLTFNLWRSLAFLPLAWGTWIFKNFGKPAGKSLLETVGFRRGVELVFVGMLSLAIAGTFVNLALKDAPASLVIPLTATSPLLSTLLAVLFFRESVSRGQWAGIFLIVIGSALVCR
ncbi:MAG: DMT family transporter [Thermovirgaceae bacterium]|nr:DMT family transporter [Thermovirgaceae bacterium]